MQDLLADPRLDWPFLRRFHFDEARFRREVGAIADGRLTTASSRIAGRIAPIEGALALPLDGSGPVERGAEALARGELAVVVLNGGMATRFGQVVKGTVEVFDGRSFLGLKAEDVRRASSAAGAEIPLVLMNSFATDEATRRHVEEHDRFELEETSLLSFTQSVLPRLAAGPRLFETEAGALSYAAPGHGDFFASARRAGVFTELGRRGVTTVLFSNVDNLGATVDAELFGAFLESGRDVMVEVTPKQRTASGAWDKGGSPALVDGRLQIVEGFRLPPDLPPTLLPDFSTNTFWFRLAAIDRPLELPWHLVEKSVDGRPALQLESIACEITSVDDPPSLAVARVPREGPRGRFFPVKEVQDLETLRPKLRARLRGEAGSSPG